MLRVGCGRKTITNRVLAPKASFFLPLQDSGSGAVNTTEFASGATPTFTRATTATTFNSSGTLITVGVGIARSYYDPTTKAYLGYLAEGASTNLALHSASVGGTSWTTASVTVTLNTKVAPDGQTTGDTLAATSSACKVLQPAINSAATYTFSCYMMRSVGSGAVTITTDNVTSTDISASLNTTAWVRVQVSKSLAAGTATFGIGLGVTSDAVFVWGAQFEQLGFASSYMPTVASTVTRNEDRLLYPTLGIILDSGGTAYCEGGLNGSFGLSVADRCYLGNDTAVLPMIYHYSGGGTATIRSFDGTTGFDKPGLTDRVGFLGKQVVSWGNGRSLTGDNLIPVNSSYNGAWIGTNILIGGYSNIAYLFGFIKNVRFWQRQLPDNVIQALNS